MFKMYSPHLAVGGEKFVESVEDEDACRSKAEGFFCTREVGHNGLHAAHIGDETIVAKWATKDEQGIE